MMSSWCCRVKQEPHGLDGLFTNIAFVRESIYAFIVSKSISHPFSGYNMIIVISYQKVIVLNVNS